VLNGEVLFVVLHSFESRFETLKIELLSLTPSGEVTSCPAGRGRAEICAGNGKRVHSSSSNVWRSLIETPRLP
jgi:hypothetical protein